MTRIPLTRPTLGAAELARVDAVLRSGMLVQGAAVAAFEAAIAARIGAAHGVAVSTGTTAIQLALLAAGVGPGDEVVVPDFCVPSVAAAVLHPGADVVLCDVDPSTFNLSPETVARALTPATRAVVAVHQFGIPCGIGALLDSLPAGRGIEVIEDAACALGARGDRGRCGAQTRLGCFSFHPRKIITTGEGGLVSTGEGGLADRLRWLRNHGMRRGPAGIVFEEIGYAGRMSDLHASIGLAQVERCDAILAGRARAAAWYRERLEAVDRVQSQPAVWHPGRVYQSLVVRLGDSSRRDRAVASLRERGIESTVGTYAIHRQAAFGARCRTAPGGLGGSEAAAAESITLPLWPEMSVDAVDRVVENLREVTSG